SARSVAFPCSISTSAAEGTAGVMGKEEFEVLKLKVTVQGNVASETLIRKLTRSGKHAELWSRKASGDQKNSHSQQKQAAPPVKDGNKNKKDQGKQDLKASKHQPKKLSPLSSDEDDDDDGEDDEVRLFDKLKQFNLLMQANNAAAGAKKNSNGTTTGGFMGGKKDGANPNPSHMKHPNGTAKKGANVAAHQKMMNTDPNAGEGRRVTDINGMTGLGLGGLGGNNNGGGGIQGNVFHGYAGLLPSHGGGQHQSPMTVNMQGYQAHPSPMMSNFRVHDNRYMQPQMMHLRSPQISPYTAYYNCHPTPYLQNNQSYNEYVTHLFSDDNTRGCVIM
ncbi:hypothetical protein BHM03_00031712, partial [Ensete ventricosum]